MCVVVKIKRHLRKYDLARFDMLHRTGMLAVRQNQPNNKINKLKKKKECTKRVLKGQL